MDRGNLVLGVGVSPRLCLVQHSHRGAYQHPACIADQRRYGSVGVSLFEAWFFHDACTKHNNMGHAENKESAAKILSSGADKVLF